MSDFEDKLLRVRGSMDRISKLMTALRDLTTEEQIMRQISEAKLYNLTEELEDLLYEYSLDEHTHYYEKWDSSDANRYWEMSSDCDLPSTIQELAYNLCKLTRPMQLVSFNPIRPEGNISTANLTLIVGG